MTTFDCKKMHPKCQAQCCMVAPIEQEIFTRNLHKVVRQPISQHVFDAVDPIDKKKRLLVLPFTADGYCPFLNKDLTCNIYEDRPDVCRKYGSEQHPMLRCPYLDKNGRERSRQEIRKIERHYAKVATKLKIVGQ